MRIETIGRHSHISIDPGEYYASSEPSVISTLLGSCVAACLYDINNRIIGMNHFLLSNPRYSRDLPIYVSEAGRYGIHAMELLINEMMAKGAAKSNLRAKVFGGASILEIRKRVGNFVCVGEVNSRFIREFLDSEKIPIIAQNLGGKEGMNIHFSNGDFSVYMRRIGRNRSERVAARDRECWRRAIDLQEKTMPSVDLWQIAR